MNLHRGGRGRRRNPQQPQKHETLRGTCFPSIETGERPAGQHAQGEAAWLVAAREAVKAGEVQERPYMPGSQPWYLPARMK